MSFVESRLKHFTNWWVFTIVLISLILSITSIPPDIVWGDTPELTAAAWSLGVPHPTGYPLYIVFTRFAQWLPFGTIAFRSHLLCAIVVALSCGIFLLFNKDLIQKCINTPTTLAFPCAFFATLSFRLTALVWEQASISEVYAIFLLLFVLTLWLILKCWEKPTIYFPSLLFVISLQLIHHRLAIFLIIFAVLVIIITFTHYKKNHHYFHCFIAFLVPFLLLAYFPLRASWDPPINWFDPDTLQGLVNLISGGQFSLILRQGINQLPYWLSLDSFLLLLLMPLAFYSFISLFSILGLITFIWKKNFIGISLIFLFLIYLAFFAVYPVGDYMTFFLPCLILVCPFISVGLAILIHQIYQSGMKTSVITICLIGFFGLSLTPAGIDINQLSLMMPERTPRGPLSQKSIDFSLLQPDWKQVVPDRFNSAYDFSTSDYGKDVFNQIPQGSLIITGLYEPTADNELNPLLYQTIVEKQHPDSIIIGAGFLLYDWYRRQINHKTSLFLDMRNDQPLASREAWLEDTWQTIIEPSLNQGPVYTTSFPLPPSWYEKAKITVIKQIELERQAVPVYYRPYLPKGYVVKIEKQPIQEEPVPANE